MGLRHRSRAASAVRSLAIGVVVGLTAVLPAPEIALLGLLEVLFGVLWAWVGAGEVPGPATLSGGLLVLGALVGNELLALAGRHRTGPAR